jgi:hypothetical protein
MSVPLVKSNIREFIRQAAIRFRSRLGCLRAISVFHCQGHEFRAKG